MSTPSFAPPPGSSQFVGEIRMFGGNFAPQDWLMCDGSLQPISEYEALFNLIGTTYGGDGQSTFALPDLRSRIPVHQGTYPGQTYIIGEQGGVESVTLMRGQMPSHTHPFYGSLDDATSNIATNNLPATLTAQSGRRPYGLDQPYRTIDPGIVEPSGGGKAHMNIQPYLCFVFIIAWNGVYPQPGQVVLEGARDD
jgi:microcystin-dependent protein